MEEHGIVVEDKGKTALVKTQKGTSCEGCPSKRSCHVLGESEMLVEVENPVRARVGEKVIFTVGPASVMKAGILFYLVPLLAFIFGVVIGQAVLADLFPGQNPDLVAGVTGTVLLAASFFGLRLYTRRLEKDDSYRARIMRVV